MGPNDLDYLLVKKLSSGQRSRVALARLLITTACLWILDEPFTSLDDSMAMMPAMKLSDFSEVEIGTRISKSGNAMPQSGDYQSEIVRTTPGTWKIVELVIKM